MIIEKRLHLSDQEKNRLAIIVNELFSDNKGLLATDESSKTLENRFYLHNIINSEESRGKFREMLYKTPQIEEFISGVIMNEETFSQKDSEGRYLHDILLSKNIKIGIKLDKGLYDFDYGQKLTAGIEDLKNRIKNEKFSKCSFAKWRSLFIINDKCPTQECINKNIKTLCKFAMICQKNGIVPILEPEISYEGDYCIDKMEEIAKKIYSTVFCYLNQYNIFIPGIILKVSFVSPGRYSDDFEDLMRIGMRNVSILTDTIPHSCKHIVFLSGGHSKEESIKFLNTINKDPRVKHLNLSFSFARGLTDDVLQIWQGNEKNIQRAQLELLSIARNCQLAKKGEHMQKY